MSVPIKELEENILATLWQEPTLVDKFPSLTEKAFSPLARPIFTLIRTCAATGATPTILSLPAEIQTYARMFLAVTPPLEETTLSYYVDLLLQAHLRDSILAELTNVVQMLQTEQDPHKALSRLQEIITEQSRKSSRGVATLGELGASLLEWLKAPTDTDIVGLWGLDRLDKGLLRGLRKGTLVVVAAGTGVGKTSLAVQVACASALHGYPVAIISLEMSPLQMAARLYSHLSDINSSLLYFKRIGDAELVKLEQDVQQMGTLPLYFCDGAFDLHQIESIVLHLRNAHGVRLFVIDYLQKVQAPTRRQDTREIEVGSIARAFKRMALQHSICILTFSQVNNEKEFRTRESRAIEHEADVVIRLYYNLPQKNQAELPDKVLLTFHLWKNRMGETGLIRYEFDKAHARFINAEVADDNDDLVDAIL